MSNIVCWWVKRGIKNSSLYWKTHPSSISFLVAALLRTVFSVNKQISVFCLTLLCLSFDALLPEYGLHLHYIFFNFILFSSDGSRLNVIVLSSYIYKYKLVGTPCKHAFCYRGISNVFFIFILWSLWHAPNDYSFNYSSL